MLAFIKNYSKYYIRNKLLILYLLNVTDIIFTLILVNTGLFNEVNPVMVGIIQNTIIATIIKVILPAILLFYLYKRMKNATNKQLKFSNVAINIILTIYVLINISHLVWLFPIPYNILSDFNHPIQLGTFNMIMLLVSFMINKLTT